MKLLKSMLAAGGACAALLFGGAQAAVYEFGRIVDTNSTTTDGISITGLFNGLALNNAGDLAFVGGFDDSQGPANGVFFAVGGAATGVIATLAPNQFQAQSLTDFQVIAYRFQSSLRSGLFAADVSSGAPDFSAIAQVQPSTATIAGGAVNNFGAAAVLSLGAPTGPFDPVEAVVRLVDNGTVTVIDRFATNVFADDPPDINNFGEIAFFGAGENSVRLYSGGAVSDVSFGDGLSFDTLALNDAGQVAVVSSNGADAFVQVSGPAGPATIADTIGEYQSFDMVSINNQGDVAFVALHDDGTSSLVLSVGGVLSTILRQGDVVDGQTVSSISLSRNSLNNQGQIAVTLDFAGGAAAIYLATPEGLGVTASTPLRPAFVDANGAKTFAFDAVQGVTVFVDPQPASAFEYAVVLGPKIASIVLPTGIGDNLFGLSLFDLQLGRYIDTGQILEGGVVFSFGLDPVLRFLITGIEESSDPFVAGLEFSFDGRVILTQTPFSVAPAEIPLPPAGVILLCGLAGLAGLRRKTANKGARLEN